tara:strand:+ start:280 stop:1173 length:894 start_codon:yes stop_codon:yes gene_type:complete
MAYSKPIGKVSATENNPTTVDEFTFWLQNEVIVRPFDIVKVSNYKKSTSYAVIEDIIHITDSPGHLGSYVSSDFGDPATEPFTKRLGLTFAKCKILSNFPGHKENIEQIDMPVLDGTPVYFPNASEIVEALGLKDIKHPIPAGFIEMSNNISVPVEFSTDFLLGSEGAHLNISGISGLATKTSYIMYLLQAIQQKNPDTAIVILNVKGKDLLRIDEKNPKISSEEEKKYEKTSLKCLPFRDVKYFYPYSTSKKLQFSQTFLDSKPLEEQHNSDKAFNFIYTYEEDSAKLDLLFSDLP